MDAKDIGEMLESIVGDFRADLAVELPKIIQEIQERDLPLVDTGDVSCKRVLKYSVTVGMSAPELSRYEAEIGWDTRIPHRGEKVSRVFDKRQPELPFGREPRQESRWESRLKEARDLYSDLCFDSLYEYLRRNGLTLWLDCGEVVGPDGAMGKYLMFGTDATVDMTFPRESLLEKRKELLADKMNVVYALSGCGAERCWWLMGDKDNPHCGMMADAKAAVWFDPDALEMACGELKEGKIPAFMPFEPELWLGNK